MSGGGERSGREGTEERGREGGGREVGEAKGRKGGAPLGGSLGPANARRALPRELGCACERPFAATAARGGGEEGTPAGRPGGGVPPSKPPAKCLGRHNQAACSAEQATRPGAERAHWVGWERLLADAGALGSGLGLTMLLRDRVAGHKRIPGLPPPRRARISCSWLPMI